MSLIQTKAFIKNLCPLQTDVSLPQLDEDVSKAFGKGNVTRSKKHESLNHCMEDSHLLTMNTHLGGLSK